jgi:Cu/Ag efflux protein CusF
MPIALKLFNMGLLAAAMALPWAATAQTAHDHKHMEVSQAAPSMTDGEVRKVDLANGKLTLKHGEIKHLDMPGMTMVFTVADKALLAKLKQGDKVRFMVVDEGGKLVVTDIRPKD